MLIHTLAPVASEGGSKFKFRGLAPASLTFLCYCTPLEISQLHIFQLQILLLVVCTHSTFHIICGILKCQWKLGDHSSRIFRDIPYFQFPVTVNLRTFLGRITFLFFSLTQVVCYLSHRQTQCYPMFVNLSVNVRSLHFPRVEKAKRWTE